MAIYESASGDGTKTLLKMLSMLLDYTHTPYNITTSPATRPVGMHRIEHLASIRNAALYPLQLHDTQYDKILFLNDIVFCASDALELLLQSFIHQLDLACSLDYDMFNNKLGFYDIWVARNIAGMAFGKWPADAFANHAESNAKLQANRPFQVQCCWNGMAALNPEPFQRYGLRFKRDYTLEIADGDRIRRLLRHHSLPDETVLYDKCSASEISLLCNDLQLLGYRRAAVVPSVRVAYTYEHTKELRRRFPPLEAHYPDPDYQIKFKEPPSLVQCVPLNSNTSHVPDGSEGLLVLREDADTAEEQQA